MEGLDFVAFGVYRRTGQTVAVIIVREGTVHGRRGVDGFRIEADFAGPVVEPLAVKPAVDAGTSTNGDAAFSTGGEPV
jgi:hypothetical protein